ncbi:MAG: hypothetical protein OEY36_03170 [Gammaproteobacteria bacterium]|nr:hypothetical protein [Gammaproteobacteria bacterium]
MKINKLLSALPLVLNACADESAPAATQNNIAAGVWKGAFSAGTISTTTSGSGAVSTFEATESAGLGVYSSDNRVFFYNESEEILFANDTPGVLNANLYYSPDYYLSNGNNAGSITSFDGNPYTYTSISGAYSGAINGNYVMLFDQRYLRGADLNRLQGNWHYSNAIGDWAFAVQADGSFSATLNLNAASICEISGEFSIIDGDKNEYAVDNVSLSNCGSYDGNYTGLATTTDSIAGLELNDSVLMAIYNTDHGFFLKPLKQ